MVALQILVLSVQVRILVFQLMVILYFSLFILHLRTFNPYTKNTDVNQYKGPYHIQKYNITISYDINNNIIINHTNNSVYTNYLFYVFSGGGLI